MKIDKVSLERAKTIHPILRDELSDILTDCQTAVGSSYSVRFSHVLRTNEEQDYLYSLGRTRGGNIVTKAKGGDSYHNYGLAVDVVLLIDKDKNGTFESVDWSYKQPFDKVVEIFKAKGWEWGGDWKFKDMPHFQKRMNYNIESLKKLPKEGLYPCL